jgi:hypothetical protein
MKETKEKGRSRKRQKNNNNNQQKRSGESALTERTKEEFVEIRHKRVERQKCPV